MPQMQTGSSSISLPHSLLSSMPLLCLYLLSSPPSLSPTPSPSPSPCHCALTSPFSLSHSGGILHLSTSTFHAHLTPLLSPPLPFCHLITPFICLLPPPPNHHRRRRRRRRHHHHKLHPFPFPPSFSHTCLRRLVQTHAALHTLMLIGAQGRSAHSPSKDGVREVCWCDRQTS